MHLTRKRWLVTRIDLASNNIYRKKYAVLTHETLTRRRLIHLPSRASVIVAPAIQGAVLPHKYPKNQKPLIVRISCSEKILHK